MTIFDASQKLLHYFSQNDSFNLDDFKKVLIISLEEDLDKSILLAALEKLVFRGIVSKTTFEKKDFWVLNQPLESYEQTVTLGWSTLSAIQETINDFCDANKLDKGKVSIVDGIKESNIADIIILLQNLVNRYKEEEN